ncbi:MAG TPA: hypothetical protein VEB65_12860 [Solirubrobacterales bacterium]|nr:hypothetical protein [Solirubrobacterales bacterium]
MRQLLAIAYEDETLAGRAAEEVGRCAGELAIDPDATSVAICGRDGGVQLTTSRRSGATGRWSEFWAVLLDAVMTADAEAEALGREFPARLRRALVPGTSALFMALAAGREQAVLEVLSPLDGEQLACALPGDLPRRWGVRGLHFET